eukprot:TRINITY_DN3268_c0_g1_i1.p2 TRINITY_DN3268_c0_g1~~TRINITY_DN3268_c0_g1_i1.p2  ORF type:complete len:348 (-),score=170.29 TRINITY_DN3268_c0_g1_i1:368-1411(-)
MAASWANVGLGQLCIAKQHSLATEKFVSNGTQKDVHVVVKNSPFFVDMALGHGGISDFANIAVQAKLMFDTEEEREVIFIKRKPLEFKAQLSDDGKEMTCEIRLKVLSSQLEDMHFRILFTAVWKESRQEIEGMSALSEPIKVVSKPEQVEKIQRGETGVAKQPARPRKRKQSDYNEALMRIEKEQRQQREMLKRLCAGEAGAGRGAGVSGGDKRASLSGAFEHLVACYKTLPPEERPMKIRRVISNTPVRDVPAIAEMLEHFQYELRRDDNALLSSSFSASAAAAAASGSPPPPCDDSPDSEDSSPASSSDASQEYASFSSSTFADLDLSIFSKEYSSFAFGAADV